MIDRLRAVVLIGAGMGLGLLVAAVQLLPLALAASGSQRSIGVGPYLVAAPARAA